MKTTFLSKIEYKNDENIDENGTKGKWDKRGTVGCFHLELYTHEFKMDKM
jgi:hypothetical protein